MLLSQLHDMIKHNYEHGLYSQGYTSKSNDSNPSKIKDLKNLSDFQMGKHQAHEDYQISKKFRFYPKLPFVLLKVDYRMKLATQLVVNKKRHSAWHQGSY